MCLAPKNIISDVNRPRPCTISRKLVLNSWKQLLVHPVQNCIYYVNSLCKYKISHSSSLKFTYVHFLVPTVCNQPRLQPWHIALIVVGAFALVVAIVMIIVNSIVASCMGELRTSVSLTVLYLLYTTVHS